MCAKRSRPKRVVLVAVLTQTRPMENVRAVRTRTALLYEWAVDSAAIRVPAKGGENADRRAFPNCADAWKVSQFPRHDDDDDDDNKTQPVTPRLCSKQTQPNRRCIICKCGINVFAIYYNTYRCFYKTNELISTIIYVNRTRIKHNSNNQILKLYETYSVNRRLSS